MRTRPKLHSNDPNKTKSTFRIDDKPELWQYCLVFTVSSLVFANSYNGEFVYDDSQAIVYNEDVTGGAATPWRDLFVNHDFWGQPIDLDGSHRSWRPLTTLTFRWNHAMGGRNTTVYHLTNILLHSLVSSLILPLCHNFGMTPFEALTSSLLFAVHPVHCEAVAGIVGRADVLSALFVIAGLLYFEKYQSVSSVFLWTSAAMLSKETGIVLPALVIAYMLLVKKEVNFPKVCQLLLVTAALLLVRLYINGFKSPKFSRSDNPFAHETRWDVRWMSLLYLPVFHIGLLIYPKELCFDWSMDAIPPILSPSDHRFWLTTAFFGSFIGGTLWLIRRSSLLELVQNGQRESNTVHPDVRDFSDRLLLSLSLMIVPYLPASNLFVYVGFVAAERILYLSCLGYCMMVATVLQLISKRYSISVVPLVVLLLSVLSTRTITRNTDWSSETALYSSALHLNPAKAYANLGHSLASTGDRTGAMTSYRRALGLRSNMADTWYNLAILQHESGNKTDAIHGYRNAISIRPNFAAAHLNLGILLWKEGNLIEAENILRNCTQLDGSRLKSYRIHITSTTSCMYNLGRLLVSRGRLHEAIHYYQQALSIAPSGYSSMTSLLISLGESLAKSGRSQLAEDYLRKSVVTSPSHVPSYLAISQLCNSQNRSADAFEWAELGLTMAPLSAALHHQMAIVRLTQGWSSAAEHLLRRAISLDSAHFPSIHAMAMLMKENKRYEESKKFFGRLVELDPSAVSYSNYGAVLHLAGDVQGAELSYLTALQLSPDDVITKENLRKLRRRRSV